MKYTYKIETIHDQEDGSIDTQILQNRINWNADQGWRLVSSFTNELGKNSSVGGYGGISIGTNATIDELVLIFEKTVVEQQESDIKIFPISKVNSSLPFIPKEITIDRSNGFMVSIASCEIKPIGLIGNIIIHTIFGQSIEINNIEFYFQDLDSNLISSCFTEFNVEKTQPIKSIREIDFLVTKWVSENYDIYEAESLEMIPVDNIQQTAIEEEKAVVPYIEDGINGKTLVCPKCGARQMINARRCFRCGVQFLS